MFLQFMNGFKCVGHVSPRLQSWVRYVGMKGSSTEGTSYTKTCIVPRETLMRVQLSGVDIDVLVGTRLVVAVLL